MIAAVLSPAVARADEWTEVASLLERLEYDTIVERLEPIASDPAREPRDRLRALEIIGVARVGAGRDDDARAVFMRLRTADPRWELQDPSYSPKIHELFDAAEIDARPRTLAVSVDRTSVGEVVIGVAWDPTTIYASELELRWCWSASGAFSLARLGRRAAADGFPIPRVEGAPGLARLRAVALAHAPSGAIVARAGTEEEPVVLEVRPPRPAHRATPSGSILTRWWLWTGVGAVVVGVSPPDAQ